MDTGRFIVGPKEGENTTTLFKKIDIFMKHI